MNKKGIKAQFNKQAEKFSKFSLTKNIKIFHFFYNFCNLDLNDCLLDVACGSGEFAVFCAKKLKYVYGLDLSDKMITLAEKKAKIKNLTNVQFICTDVEKIPFENGLFTVASCRSALHHMKNYDKIFSEMVRCVKKDGKICIQDMITYKDKQINEFFEKLEKNIDISHNNTLSEENLFDLFDRYNIKIVKKFVSELEHNFNEYISHAVQSNKNALKMYKLIEKGLNDSKISKFLYIKHGEIFFKRAGTIMWGIKSK
ncbi:MAG: class I SAM-dependent methyltransferase [Promethearchaeota archaeon]